MKAAIVIALAGPAAAFSPAVGFRPARTARVAPAMGVADIFTSAKDAIAPTNTDKTISNVFGYQALAWGLGGLLAPAYVATNVVGMAVTPTTLALSRGMALSNLGLAGRFFSASDADAASTGFVWFAGWWYVMKNAGAAFNSQYVPTLIAWNAIMAIVCARRTGGLFSVVTKADTGTLSSLLPRDYEKSTRNFVGMQMCLWGIAGWFFSSRVVELVGVASTAATSAIMAGLAVSNLVLGGKVMGGNDADAAANGVTYFGGWAAIMWLAKSAGTFTGSYVNLLVLWNAASALFCAKTLMD